MNSFINYQYLKTFDKNLFIKNEPFPWYGFQEFLTPAGFQQLYQDFPSLELFEKHEGIERVYGQRPHNRYYLAYETSIYNQLNHRNQGVVRYQELPKTWQMFIEELETSQDYRDFIKCLLSVSDFEVRYAWHIGVTNSEVSPHRDADEKIGTHILYFNTSDDWDAMWGGSTLVLGGKLQETMNPDFDDFSTIVATPVLNNQSFLFKNTPDAWHGVKPLNCPEIKYRRLFNIILEFPQTRSRLPLSKRLLNKALQLLNK